MMDPRIPQLADVLINHSTKLQPGEHVLIETFDAPDEIVVALIEAARAKGAHPHVATRHNRILRAMQADAPDDNLDVWARIDRHRMEQVQAYIGVRGALNVSELSDIDQKQMQQFARRYSKPVHYERRINHTRWCVLRWPTPSMAQLAQMSTDAFEDFYFNACTVDYAKMAESVQPLAERMRGADKVHIKGPVDTDLQFSIRDIPVVPCSGSHNIPDGECFTAPVRDSVNGVIHFNTPTIYNGISFENVRLEFRNGQIVDCTADQNAEKLETIFDTDDGARYVGEFAIGFHPLIREPMKDILFDEKITGSLHFTPGRAYEDANNGNKSEIHWDLVLIQREDYGGGELSFDDEVIRRDGMFLPDDLQPLNPDALVT